MTNERRSNADYLQEIWDSLEGVWDKSKYNMEKGYDDEYGCECITISLRDNEDVRAKIYVEDHEGQHPTGFEVVYRYPGDKGVGIGGYYEFQSTDMDGLGEEVFDYFDEIKNKVGESMTNEKLFTLYDIHGNYPNFGKPSCWRDPQFWKDYEDYYSLAYPDVGIKITMKDDDSVDVTSNGEFIMNYSWKNGRHHATGADGSGFKHPGFGFRDDLSMLYRGTKGKEMGPYVPVYLDDAEQADESKQNEGKNEVSNFSRDSLGVSFDGKFGNMRKGESWVVYPETLDKGYICIQGDTRFGYINVNKGFLVLSAPHSTPIYAALMVDINKGKAQRIPLEKEIVDQILNAVNDRTITDHSLDNVIRNADVTDDELKGEAKQTEATKKYYGYGKDDVIDKEDTDFMWQVAYDWFEDRLPERLKGKADSAVYKVIDKDSRAYEEILTMDDYHDYLQKYGPGIIKDIKANDEAKKLEAEGSLGELIDKVDNMFHYHNKNLNNYQYNTIDDLLEALKSKDTNKIKEAISNLDNLVHYRNKNLNNSQYYLLDELLEALQKKYMKSEESKKSEVYDRPVTLYATTRYDDAEEAQKFLDSIGGGEVKVSTERNGNTLYVSIEGDDDAIDTFLAVYKDNYDTLEKDCDADVMGWTDLVDLKYYTAQGRKELTGESHKKSESLTLKQKELKDMARYGQAEDITTISDAEAKELKKKGIETVGISRGVYGMNGALLRDKDGNKYVITARSSNLFYFV